MIKILRASLLGGAIIALVQQADAFSLAGPLAPWQSQQLGYQTPPSLPGAGVMNLNEEYRWNVQGRFYGYSAEFLTYFGAIGATEIDKAVAMINSLPAMDTLRVEGYPLESLRINQRASALGLRHWNTTSGGVPDPSPSRSADRRCVTARGLRIVTSRTKKTRQC